MAPMAEQDMVNLNISIEDSGQGIKPEDLDKLFGSFQQVDTKKNRNKEGTGLGLAISKQLVETMGGQIGVRSEYGKGSEFYFHIPQRVIGDQIAATVREDAVQNNPVVVSGHMKDGQILEQLKRLTEGYGLKFVDCYEARDHKVKVDYFFVDESVYRGLKLLLKSILSQLEPSCVCCKIRCGRRSGTIRRQWSTSRSIRLISVRSSIMRRQRLLSRRIM